MDGAEDGGGGDVVQVIMQDDGQIVMPEGQFIQLDKENSQMQYIQVTGENGEEQLIQLTPEIQAQLFEVQQEEGGTQMAGEGQAEIVDDNLVEKAEELHANKEEGEEEAVHVVIETTGENAIDSASSSSPPTLNYKEAVSSSDSIPVTVETRTTITSPSGGSTSVVLVQPPGTISVVNSSNMISKLPNVEDEQNQSEVVHVKPAEPLAEESDESSQMEDKISVEKPEHEDSKATLQVRKVVDEKNPIALTSETVVVVNGKKCVLRVDPESNHLVAYPVKTEGKRGRGRPRKSEQSQPTTPNSRKLPSQATSPGSGSDTSRLTLTEQENSAAEGLLGLSDCDGVRRSTRKRRKNKVLSEYETGAIEGMEDADIADDGATDPEAHPEVAVVGDNLNKKGVRGRPPKSSTTPVAAAASVATNLSAPMQQMLMKMGLLPMKRGRGRPRRSPLPGTTAGGPVPAFIIPSPGGSGVMMAPIQNLAQLEALKKAPGLTVMKSPEEDDGQTLTKDPKSVIIKNQDGSETIIVDTNPATETDDTTKGDGIEEEREVTDEEADKSMESENSNEAVNDGKETTETAVEESESKRDVMPPAAIVQLPQDLVQLLLPQKPPVKIGLKATESELEKLKCPKCDFQAYFQQQFQEHIGTHPEAVERCKCCNHLCFTEEELLDHFREAHPRCICPECNFTAEHAYVIKRHRIRHNNQGCECEICGKKYKDPYILKMHIKMVHMPAEVLYCCDICKKKFTRKAHLKRHLRIHEPEKPFKCPHCDYRGCERSDITKHVLIHEEPKHSCDVCGKTFRHMKNKDLHVKRHKGQRDYKCGVCDFYGYTFTDIRKHIERKHADAKTISCDKCGSTFRNEIQLRDHQRRQCEVLMLDQTVSDGQTIQIPASQLTSDGHIMVDGNKVKFTVEPLTLGDDAISMTLQDGQLISTDGQVINTSQVEMTEIAIGDQQNVMDVEQVELTTAELVASSQEAEIVQETQLVQESESEMIQDDGTLVPGTEIIAQDGILTIAQ